MFSPKARARTSGQVSALKNNRGWSLQIVSVQSGRSVASWDNPSGEVSLERTANINVRARACRTVGLLAGG